jgi:DNA-binding transcriptional MerR regulator
MDKSPDAFRTISEAAEELDLPQHVLRFWETRFPQIKPMKRGGGRRYYRPEDVELLASIRHLLYGEGYTIKGVQRILKQQHGAKAVIELVQQLKTQRAPAGAVALATAAGRSGSEYDDGAPVSSVATQSRAEEWQEFQRLQYHDLRAALAAVEEALEILGAARAA